MIARYCSWCEPRRLLEEIPDGKLERIQTDTICPACTERLLGLERARAAYRELADMVMDGRATLVTPRVRT